MMHKEIKKKVASLSELYSAFRWCLSLSWGTSRLYTALRILAEALTPALSIVITFIGKNVIDLLAGQSIYVNVEKMLLFLLGSLFVAIVIRSSSQKLMQYFRTMHEDMMDARIAAMIMDNALKADLEYFDNPDFTIR